MGIFKDKKEEYKAILKESRDLYGDDFIIDLIEEECLELALAIQKLKKRGYTEERFNHVIEELGDVFIMLEHSKSIFPVNKIKESISLKMERQIKRNSIKKIK